MPESPSPSISPGAVPARANGFTLLEVLIAVLVVAVGLLGMAKLQTVGLSGSKNARTRAMAALQAESLAAILQALPSFWAAAPQDFSLLRDQVFLTGGTLPLVPSVDCSTVDCADADFALFAMQRWAAAMNMQFPGYSAQVACDASMPRQCTVRLQWFERPLFSRSTALAPGAASPTVQTFVLHVLP